jgi:hypothetical protein
MYINKWMNEQMNKGYLSAMTHRLLAIALCAACAGGFCAAPFCYAMPSSQQTQGTAAPRAVAKRIGVIKAINGTEITLTPDSGPDVKIIVQAATQIVRFAPGETNVNNATPIQLQDLQVGDHIRATGWAADDNLPLPVLKVVVMKHSDLEARHQQDLQDWQKRGVGGLVSAVDPAAGTVTISIASFTARKNIVIHASKTTVIRRYPPDSWQFDDAKDSTLQQIHPDDQLSARGDRNADGTELTAEEIVSGEFRNVAGTVSSVDASSSTLSVQDLLSKKTVLVKIARDSLLRQVPPEMALQIATRWKTAAAGGTAAASGGTRNLGSGQPAATGQNASPTASAGGTSEGGTGARASGMGGRSGGAPDFQQMINRMPAFSLAELHKGDAVMIVATEGTSSEAGTAIKLISGVEPILRAAPSAIAAQSMMLGSWSLGGAPAGDSGGP